MASAGSPNLANLPGTAPATLGDWQYQIGDLVIGRGTVYHKTGESGFGTPEVRSSDTAKSAEDGDWMGIDTYGSRVLTLDLTVRGDGPAGVEAVYQDLLAAWYNDPKTPYTNLWWKLPGLPPQRVIGRPRRVQANKDRALSGTYEVVCEFYSPFSFIAGESVHVSATPRVVAGGGRQYPLTYPRQYNIVTTGGDTARIENTGAYPTVLFVAVSGGAASYPRLYDLSTGEFIGFDVTLSDGEVLTIDMRLRTASIGGRNIRQNLSVGSTWFKVPPRSVSELAFTATTVDSSVHCDITFMPVTLG